MAPHRIVIGRRACPARSPWPTPPEPPIADDVATTAAPIAEPLAGPRLCAHADRDGKDAHWLAPGTTCQAEPSYEPEAGE